MRKSRIFAALAILIVGRIMWTSSRARESVRVSLPSSINSVHALAPFPLIASIVFDSSQSVISTSPAAATLFGIPEDEMEGMRLSSFLIDVIYCNNRISPVPNQSTKLVSNAPLNIENCDFVATGLHAGGTKISLSGSFVPTIRDGVEVTTAFFRDADDRRRLRTRLARSHNELRQLSASLQAVREEERTHIARELHDDLGQLMASLQIDLALIQQLVMNNEQTLGLIGKMQLNLSAAISSLRRIAKNLRPRALDDGGLYYALRGLIDEFALRYNIKCSLYADEADLQLDGAASTMVFRVVQEALNNIARHANATNVILNLFRLDGEMLITIRDDGRGVTESDLSKAGSLGLIGMRERVWGMRGEMTVTSIVPSGTSIDIVFPLGDERS